ncbi:hypothetical protein ID866_6054 [Astraeus odoratus]|nr:hypothetical protein ID866_6054 [Astraeus odoratus]
MRRTNKSHKVPNVKLRPAQVPERCSQHRDTTWPDNSSDSEIPPSASMVDLCPRPFRGVTVCATGQVDKPTLFKQAFELGAMSTSDFTDRVTHLVANAHGGAKYMCALERKIPIMAPEWISKSYAIWLRGDDVDFQESTSKYKLPIFSGVVLSLSGIEDVNRRAEINRLLTAQQGVYVKNLERPVKVTHLLCSGDMETDKMRYAEKFNQRGEASIHLVWEEWFWDCLEFGGRFEEKKYHVKRPRPERRSLHNEPSSTLPTQNSVHASLANLGHAADNLPQAPESQSNSAVPDLVPQELEEEEAAAIRRAPAVTLQLWQTLLKPRGFELDGGKLVRSPSKSQGSQPVAVATGLSQVNNREKEKGSVITAFRRTNSFAPQPKEPTLRQPFKRGTIAGQGPEDAEGSGMNRRVFQEADPAAMLFSGYTFRLLGEARCPNVRSAVETGGGVVSDDDTTEVNFIIVRLISGSKLYQDEPDEFERAKYRTECWLEHSVFLERICTPEENVSFTPLDIPVPIPDAESVMLSLSGLDQSELCWIRRLLRALGIPLAQNFSRRSTHLLCPSGQGTKFGKALEWRIPVISMAWLDCMAREGRIPDVGPYLVSSLQNDLLTGINPLMSKKNKGKGKEIDVRMVDMVNNGRPSQALFVKKSDLLQDAAPGEQAPCSSNAVHQPAGIWFGKPPGPLNGHLRHAPDISPPPSPLQLPPPSSSPAPDTCLLVPVRPSGQLNGKPIHPSPTQDIDARIPSSKSPSPIKLLPSSIPGETPTPEFPPPGLGDVAKALEKTLTTLLGKRTSDENTLPQTRKGKRPRPQPPSKLKPRQDSPDSLASLPRAVPEPEFDNSCYEDINVMEGVRSTDESMRVTYEDPVQLQEKRRLMTLLGVETSDPVETTTSGRKGRKTTRNAGSRAS